MSAKVTPIDFELGQPLVHYQDFPMSKHWQRTYLMY